MHLPIAASPESSRPCHKAHTISDWFHTQQWVLKGPWSHQISVQYSTFVVNWDFCIHECIADVKSVRSVSIVLSKCFKSRSSSEGRRFNPVLSSFCWVCKSHQIWVYRMNCTLAVYPNAKWHLSLWEKPHVATASAMLTVSFTISFLFIL